MIWTKDRKIIDLQRVCKMKYTCDNCNEECSIYVEDSTVTHSSPTEVDRMFRWGIDCTCGNKRGKNWQERMVRRLNEVV